MAPSKRPPQSLPELGVDPAVFGFFVAMTGNLAVSRGFYKFQRYLAGMGQGWLFRKPPPETLHAELPRVAKGPNGFGSSIEGWG